jgi:hypothetical protein
MNHFITKVFSFIFILLGYFSINASLNYFIITFYKPEIKKTNTLIIGDSHSQRGINPDLFSCASNISQPGEPIVITYWKLKYLLKYMKPDTLIIGFGHHNISSSNDTKFIRKRWSSEMLNRSYIIKNMLSVKSIPIDFNEYYKVIWKQFCFYPHKNHFKFIGNFSKSNGSNLSDVHSSITRHFFSNNKELSISYTAISHLDSVINICQKHRIVTVLAGIPVHTSYYSLIPLPFKERYDYEINRYENQGIIILNRTFESYKDSLYFDSHHLNIDGAKIFTKQILSTLNTKIKNQ